MPSKALIRSAKMLAYARRAEDFGFRSAAVEFSFAQVMERVQRVIRKVAPHDSVERYTKLGVDVIREDADISEMIRERFAQEGIRVLTGHQARQVHVDGGRKTLICRSAAGEVAVPFDTILVAVGRAANARGFGLEELGVTLRSNGTIETNGLLQTNYPNIYATGDVAGPTLAEANKYAAGSWKRAHAPERLLSWIGKYHARVHG